MEKKPNTLKFPYKVFCMSDGFEHWNDENIEWKKRFTSNIKF